VLVLTRRIQQSIRIGDDITITVIEVRGDQVRLGIEAPRNVPVHRTEVLLQVERQNAEAARGALMADIAAALSLLGAGSTAHAAYEPDGEDT
jgi:carbon storage regulator